jgi:hypothetical protein
MGPEPLGEAFDARTLVAAFNGRKQGPKTLLLDQKTVAGLGNIYVCEALHRAHISPFKPAGMIAGKRLGPLAAAIKAVLAEAVEVGGSSLKDFAAADGALGYFQHRFRVYDREGEQFAGALQRRQQGGLVAGAAIELRLLGLLFRAVRRFAAQAQIAVEAQLQSAGFVLEEFVDDRPFARAGGLEEGDLALRFERDDLAQVGAGDGGFAHEMGGALFHDIAAGAEARRQEQAGVAGLEFQAGPGLRAGQLLSPSGFTGTVAVE